MHISGWRVAALLLGLFAAPAGASDGPTLMRFPTLNGNTVVFEAHGNLWQVSRLGGTASRLTTDPGYDLMPRFSPDGRWIAFTGSYQGNQDVYVIPAGGGEARRLTFHSDVVDKAPTRWGPDNMVVTWTPDSKNIVFLSRRDGVDQLVRTAVRGSGRRRLRRRSCRSTAAGLMSLQPGRQHPSPITASSATSAPGSATTAAWRRMSIPTISTPENSTHVTDWTGTDTAPMWYGRQDLFPRPTATRIAARISGSTTRTPSIPRGHPFHRLRHRLSQPRRQTASSSSRAARSMGPRPAQRAAARGSMSACPTTACAPAPALRRALQNSSAMSTRRGRSITRWRPTASARCSPRAAISSAFRRNTAPRGI